MGIIFIYSKKGELAFYDEPEANKRHNLLIDNGYSHVATVHGASALNAIYKIAISGSNQKAREILTYFGHIEKVEPPNHTINSTNKK
jgi:hypothetical protein